MNLPLREEFKQSIRLTVRWGDADMFGHVNNAKFFTYAEQARIEYFDALREQDPKFGQDYGIILASTACDFLVQLHYPAQLDVGMRIEKIGRSSMTARTGIFVGERAVATVSGVIVWFDYQQQKTLPVPDHVRAWIRAREVVAPIE
ncbi:MAG: acyl-CoA thioesterase [Nevskia sp.]|nr:acyl-CoA thioesterase [Nevskia sp.]